MYLIHSITDHHLLYYWIVNTDAGMCRQTSTAIAGQVSLLVPKLGLNLRELFCQSEKEKIC